MLRVGSLYALERCAPYAGAAVLADLVCWDPNGELLGADEEAEGLLPPEERELRGILLEFLVFVFYK